MKKYDVIIIGGSYAGLSAAMSLGRSLRKVLVIDSGLPCNRYTPHSHNFITHDGEQPAIITAKAKEQVLQYPTVNIFSGLAASGSRTGNEFNITTDTGETFHAKKLIFATGITDRLPAIEGFSECWGKSIVHCPYCHGYEIRGQNTAVLANGERAFHLATLLKNLTDQITIITSGAPDFNESQLQRLGAHHITIIETELIGVLHTDGQLRALILRDGRSLNFEAMYAALPFKQHCDIPVALGCQLTAQGHISVDGMQKTSVDGVFACGDNASMLRSVANAVHTGNFTGAVVNRELCEERF